MTKFIFKNLSGGRIYPATWGNSDMGGWIYPTGQWTIWKLINEADQQVMPEISPRQAVIAQKLYKCSLTSTPLSHRHPKQTVIVQ